MKLPINKKNIFYRLQQLAILILHLVLLKWMLYTLQESGVLPFTTVFFHFLGMSIYGGLLIFGTAKWAKRKHLQELSKESRE